MVSNCFIGLCVWGFMSVAGLITFSVLLGVANTDDYIRNCTVVSKMDETGCYLVSPRHGNITFPYEPQYKEYTGGSMPCRYINETLTCYTYDEDHRASEDEKPDIVTRVTTSYSRAFSAHNVTIIIFLIIFGLSTTVVSVIAFYLAWTVGVDIMTHKSPCCNRGGYDEL